MRRTSLAGLIPVALIAAACGGGGSEQATTAPLTSSLAFAGGDVSDGGAIDPTFTCDGANTSPALRWKGVPDGAAELALVVDDPDAPGGSFVHWVAYAIEPGQLQLTPGIPTGAIVAGGTAGMRQGQNDAGGRPGYTGPCPPVGETHRYVFTLYALDSETGLDGGATRDALLDAVDGHVIGEATLTASYARQ